MSNFFQRVKGAFGGKPRRQQPPTAVAPNSASKIRPSYQTDDDDDGDDNDGEVQSLTTYVRPPQPRLRDQPRNTNDSDDDARDRNVYQEGSTPLSNPQLRGTSNGLGSDVLPNNNINRNATPISNPGIRAGLPPQTQDPSSRSPLNPISSPINNLPSSSGGLPPDTNRNQTISPSTNPIAQSSLAGSFPADKNLNLSSQAINPNSALVGFPPSMNPRINQRSKNASSLFNQPFASQQNFFRQRTRRPFPTSLVSFQPRVELDYPIENVIIDGNIPSSIAHKINQAVEYDRFGNPRRYAYKPTPQHISMRNNQRTPRRFNSHHGGTRHIREINHENYHPQVIPTQHCTNIQPILINTPQITCQIICSQYNPNPLALPINHYTAYALPNDPMRYY